MQAVKNIIKTSCLITIITVIYSVFLNEAELPLLLCVCYAIHNKSFLGVTVVSVITGAVTCAFGGYSFLYGMLLCLYASYIFFLLKPKKKPFLNNFILFFVWAIISLGRNFLLSTLFFAPFYMISFKIYKEKEKYIFS